MVVSFGDGEHVLGVVLPDFLDEVPRVLGTSHSRVQRFKEPHLIGLAGEAGRHYLRKSEACMRNERITQHPCNKNVTKEAHTTQDSLCAGKWQSSRWRQTICGS
ncbi:hypothetical protein L596_003123 [Steinernema carpocapsae]|uniref:Uncharacterized protein n=1 Tax=Steinernema carpocapsae TaxID=34508 RepID=A0A4U8UUF0_STECR|nr:hypothetical protein L596_003123 [Steinernema carpocapsae]